jgi:tRNA threonylcarbamoyladenosine biosynthesis protein TsaB
MGLNKFKSDPPIILALDTSGPRLQIALGLASGIKTRVEDIARGHAEILFIRLADFLKENNISYQDLTRIIVSTGPGSFTGLRIGIAAARGLALALNIPVIGVPNLFALSLAQKNIPFSIVIDARRDQFYAQHFEGPGAPLNKPQLLDREQMENQYTSTKTPIYTDPKLDIICLTRFGAGVDVDEGADKNSFPPCPCYVRAADAKPQTKLQVATKS